MLISGTYAFSDLMMVLTLGLLLNLLFGGPLTFYRRLGLRNPGRLFTGFVQSLEARLNRSRRSEGSRRWRGFILLCFVSVVSLSLGAALHRLSLLLPYGSLLYILLIAGLIRPRTLFDEAREVAKSLDILGLEPSRPLLASLVRRDAGTIDLHTAVRATIEYLAEAFIARIVTPSLWFVLLGLPGLLLARAIGDLYELIGYHSSRFVAFGAATIRINALLTFIPARLGALLLVLASLFIPACKPFTAFGIMWQQAHQFASSGFGWPVSAMAGALRLTLGGPRIIASTMMDDPWTGIGTARATTTDLRRAGALFAVATLLLVIVCAATLYLLPV